jgi:hypothetical protein
MGAKGVLAGGISGGLAGFGAGIKTGNPWATAGLSAAGLLGGMLGASADTQETEEERRARMELEQKKLAEEKRMNNQSILQQNRSGGMSALGYLANQRGTANENSRYRQARDLILRGAGA